MVERRQSMAATAVLATLLIAMGSGLLIQILAAPRRETAAHLGIGSLVVFGSVAGAWTLGKVGRRYRCGWLAAVHQGDKLRIVADTDLLTALPNRRSVERTLVMEVSRARRHGRQLSLLMLDVDDFKSINDTFGHPAGDQVLRRISGVIRTAIRDIDAVGRFGGEEFLIILPETGVEGAAIAAQRVIDAVADAAYASLSPGRRVTASIGVATWIDDGDNPQAMIERADRALYLAKSAGKNRISMATASD